MRIYLGNDSTRQGFTDYTDSLQGEPEQLESVFLQRCGAGDDIEGSNCLKRRLDTVLDYGGEVLEQVVKTLHRQAAGSAFSAGLGLS